MNEQDRTILYQLRRGDEKAYLYLFTHYYVSLYKAALLYVENSFVAENLVADLMLYLWQQRDSLDIHTSLRAYLFTAIRRRSINYLQEAQVTHEATLSEHLNELKRAGLIQGEINPPYIKYCINCNNWEEAKRLMGDFFKREIV
jgi:DNA-directed RNA polymerase specialized sigma subunit, sigma24 homolog